LIGGEHDIGSKDAFESFKQQYGRQYNSVEGIVCVFYDIVSCSIDESIDFTELLIVIKNEKKPV